MLDNNQIAAASQTLHDHWRAGTKLAALEACASVRATAPKATRSRPRSKAIRPRHLFGWKIAATSEAGQKHINVDGPMAGRILAETVIADGGTASMAGNEMRVAEPEFAFRMRTDLPARSAPYTRAAGARRRRHAASGDRDSGFAVCGFRQRRRRADHRRQCLRASVRARPAGDGGLARARSGRGAAGHHAARRAIHRPRQERARRSPDRAGMARQRIAPARRDAEGRPSRHHRHLPSAAADPIRRFVRGRFRRAGQSVGGVR